jgi:hypothetical protein
VAGPGVVGEAGQKRQAPRKDDDEPIAVIIDEVEVPPGEATGLIQGAGRRGGSGVSTMDHDLPLLSGA